jgi:hypothetical protein
VLVRLLVLSIALGLWVGAVDASKLDTDALGLAPTIALVDEVEDGSDSEILPVPWVAVHYPPAGDARAASLRPPQHDHQHFVFRPPRTPAFN